ncbi:MAG TPA: zinc-binding dehydrogenase [Vicinamibacterales bacterium]|nr:zinc-binding dehydrogenase [Vicinamibacterales bacterium]
MMTAAILDAAPGGLRLEQIPVPEPRAGEILVKVSACGVCHTDLHVMKAEVAFPTPAVMGHEISGTVAALGPGVSGPPVGTRVASAFIMPCGFCVPCGAGRDDLCDSFFAMNRLKGTLYDGTSRLARRDGSPIAMYSMAGLAEYSVVPATDVFPLPEGLPLEESAVLGCAVFTAYGAVRHGADLRGGESIAVVAVGGVGINIIQIAKAFGASQIIAVDVRDDKLEAARRLGATDVVNSRTSDATARVREMTGGRGVDLAFEVLGIPQTFQQAFEMIRDGGRMVAVGIAPGKTAAPVEITRLVRRELRIVGSYGARTRTDMPDIIRLAAHGIFRPETMVTQRFSLDHADAAYQALARGDIVGRAIVVP